MKKLHLFVLCAVFLLAACLTGVLVSCQDGQTETSSATGTGTPTEPQASASATDTEPETEPVTAPGTDTETDTTPETDTETETETETEGIKLNIKADALNPLMTSLWSGDEVRNETVMFLDAGEAKSLLYRADCILSVTGYDGKRKYTEGVDYALQDGKIVALEGGALPTITSAKYYGADSTSLLMTKYNGKNVYTHWGEGRAMTDWQVNVTYTHSDSWEGYRQTCEIGQFAGLVDKLNRGEDVTFIFYGDSITNGASASFVYNYAPQQYSYPLLLTQALADLFGYNVHYVQTGLNGTSRIPNQDYSVENARGTITYINPAIGGWNTQQGLDNYDSHVKPFIEQYGCDLFVLAFGMNDAGGAPRTIAATQKKLLNRVLEQSPAAGLLIVSPMVPNPDATNGWYGNQEKQQKSLQSLAEEMRARNASCAVACMTSVSKAVLEHKSFRDYSGNNINHPNDFFSRVYAQCLLETLIGYGNIR